MMQQLIAVAVRITAIFIFIWFLQLATTATFYLQSTSVELSREAVMLHLWPPLGVLMLAVLLWLMPERIARLIAPKSIPDEALKDMPVARIEASVLTVIGIALLAIVLTDTVYWLTYIVRASSNLPPQRSLLAPYDYAAMITTGAELIVGLWLTLGSRGIINLVHRFRYAGSQR